MLIRVAAALAWFSCAALAVDFGALQPQGYLSDFAQVVDAGSRQRLEAYCARVEKATGAQLAIVTIPTLGGEPIEDVATLLFERWKIGKKGEDTGALFLLVIQDRKSRLEAGYGLEPILPDGAAGTILREMRPALRAGDYGAALVVAASSVGGRIARAKGVSLEDPGADARRRHGRGMELPGGAFLALMAAMLLMGLLGSSRRNIRGRMVRNSGAGEVLAGIVLGQLLSGGRGPRSGGGFGGFDGSGGFGGFGGGMSGGGGASSDW